MSSPVAASASSPSRERVDAHHETEPVIKEGWLLKRSNKSRRVRRAVRPHSFIAC